MYSARLVDTLNEIAQRYQPLMLKSVQEVLSQSRYRNTGAGVASVTVDVEAGDVNKAPAIRISFEDHLIFLNQRKIEWTRLPNMKNLVAWAETKKSNEAEAKQLAWATAWDKKKNDTWKPKLWRKKSLSTVLKEMNALILSEYDKAIEEDLQDATKV